MRLRDFALLLIIAAIVSYAAGFASDYLWRSHTVRQHQAQQEDLRLEVFSFFYDTMRQMSEVIQGSEQGRVSEGALKTWNQYRSKVEPRCWLINVSQDYGGFYGQVLFPSGDLFEVRIARTGENWRLDYFHHLATNSFYQGFAAEAPQTPSEE